MSWYHRQPPERRRELREWYAERRRIEREERVEDLRLLLEAVLTAAFGGRPKATPSGTPGPAEGAP